MPSKSELYLRYRFYKKRSLYVASPHTEDDIMNFNKINKNICYSLTSNCNEVDVKKIQSCPCP
jgi:hypothetical protein